MTFILERLAIGNSQDMESPGTGIGCMLNVAEEIEVDPALAARHDLTTLEGKGQEERKSLIQIIEVPDCYAVNQPITWWLRGESEYGMVSSHEHTFILEP